MDKIRASTWAEVQGCLYADSWKEYALGSLMSRPDHSLDAWLSQHRDLGRRLIVPAELKWEVRDKLDQTGINERVLFPGLDGLTRWVARHYAPRRP